ncbi:trafficking protein particle complex subunit 3 [Nannochloropsis gaditana]|uniref:Trafficking protein particle complex subunit n=1 Tax=Nannochloropsis gaditana TaxID=72520 RepID=W7TW04_9STRA|nr:trafficking protein particle complex subunit 3 [Nannochloropsis gaditana]
MSSSSSRSAATRAGDQAWTKMSKMNAELFNLTYGAMVMQLIRDYEDVQAVNQQLETMGYSIGQKLVDEFLAKSGVGNCANFREVAETLAKVGFKMFLGVVVEVTAWNAEGTAFSLQVYDNPLADFVELPPQYSGLVYSNILCGVIRGALEMIKYQVECRFVKDGLKGDEVNEIRVELRQMVDESFGEEYNEGA